MGNWEGEVVGETDGGVVGRFKGGCYLGKSMDLILAIMWNGCEVGSVAGVLLRGTKLRLSAYAHRDACAERRNLLLGIYHKL